MNDKKGQLIVLERPLNRKQLALPPLSSITGWKYWNGAMGGWVGGGLLDWQLEQWGVRGHAVPLPFTVQAGGHRERATPGPGSHRWALWSVIMGPVAPSCLSALYQRQTPNRLICPCVSTYFHTYICMCASSQLCID